MTRSNLFLSICLLAAILLLIFTKGCKCNGGGGKETIKYDTVYKEVKGDTTYVPKIDTIIKSTTRVKTDFHFDTLYVDQEIIKDVDTLAILKDFYSKVIYKDTQIIQYGKIIIQDTITKNRIASRKLSYDLKIPEITKTVTLTKPERTQAYFGINSIFNQGTNTIAVGGSLLLKFKNGFGMEGGAFVDTKNNLIFGAGLKYLIRVKKK
jgi:hypothetical protein